MLPAKVEAIAKWHPPRTGKEVAKLLITVKYSRKLLKDFAIVSAPLDHLRTVKRFDWSDELQSSFEAVKRCVIKATCVAIEDPHKEVINCTDASCEGLGFRRGQCMSRYSHIPTSELKMN